MNRTRASVLAAQLVYAGVSGAVGVDSAAVVCAATGQHLTVFLGAITAVGVRGPANREEPVGPRLE